MHVDEGWSLFQRKRNERSSLFLSCFMFDIVHIWSSIECIQYIVLILLQRKKAICYPGNTHYFKNSLKYVNIFR
jgi:hypothetical protein